MMSSDAPSEEPLDVDALRGAVEAVLPSCGHDKSEEHLAAALCTTCAIRVAMSAHPNDSHTPAATTSAEYLPATWVEEDPHGAWLGYSSRETAAQAGDGRVVTRQRTRYADQVTAWVPVDGSTP